MPTLPLMAFTSLSPASRSIPKERFFEEKEQSSFLIQRKYAAAPKARTRASNKSAVLEFMEGTSGITVGYSMCHLGEQVLADLFVSLALSSSAQPRSVKTEKEGCTLSQHTSTFTGEENNPLVKTSGSLCFVCTLRSYVLDKEVLFQHDNLHSEFRLAGLSCAQSDSLCGP